MTKKVIWDEMIDTDEIMDRIKKEGPGYFLKGRKRKLEAGIYLEHLMEERGITRKEVIYKLNLEESYGRKIFGGRRTPTRKILIQCAFLLSLDLKETQRLLEIGRKPRLYPKVRYDAAIIHGIEKKMSLEQMNTFLEEIGEDALYDA